jgi:tetratricopeptide (TPR) repeat protein
MQADHTTQQDLVSQLQRTEGYLAIDPDNTDLLAAAIDLSLATADIARAQRHAAAACARYPGDPYFDYRRGHVLVALQQWSEAAALFATLLADHRDVNLAYSLANCQLQLGRFQVAATTLAPYSHDSALPPEAATLLVRALHFLGQFDEADGLIAAHRPRLAADAGFLAAASLLYLDAGKLALAQELSEQAIASGPRPIEALVVHATLALAHTDAGAAIDGFNEVLARNPREGRSWSGLGMASLLRHDLGGAKVQLEQAVKFMPGHIGSWHALGWCRLLQHDLDGAHGAFAQALALDRNFGESHGALAVVAALRGDRVASEAGIERGLRLDPTGLSARYAEMVLSGQASDPERFKVIARRVLGMRQTLFGDNLATAVERHAL